MRLGDAYMVMTNGFLNEIPENARATIMQRALQAAGSKGKNKYGELIPDFIIFDPNATGIEWQDDNRSLKIPHHNLPSKVYAKLDDYGDAETLSEQVGHKVNTKYVLTFMLAEEY